MPLSVICGLPSKNTKVRRSGVVGGQLASASHIDSADLRSGEAARDWAVVEATGKIEIKNNHLAEAGGLVVSNAEQAAMRCFVESSTGSTPNSSYFPYGLSEKII